MQYVTLLCIPMVLSAQKKGGKVRVHSGTGVNKHMREFDLNKYVRKLALLDD